MNKKQKFILFILSLTLIWSACSKVSGPAALFRKLSPHDTYGQHLKDAGLAQTNIGSKWLQSGDESVAKPLVINLPYKETGYFPADKTPAASFKFTVKQGQYIHIALTKKPEVNFKIFIDIFQQKANAPLQLVASADTLGKKLDYEVKQAGEYILRLQPELLSSGEYTLTVTAGPSLAFPVSASGKPHIGSFWGDSRDEGGRKHEGIDIFSPKGTPAIAAANGTTTISENKLGGLVVFLRPENEDYTLYYAHLGVQLVHNGQNVRAGDTVGLIDNTGNAKNTPSHLHFGIYKDAGAIDPFPFVNREVKEPVNLVAPISLLNASARTNTESRLYISPDRKLPAVSVLPQHTALTVDAATDDWYKVTLPNGLSGYISSKMVNKLAPLRTITLKSNQYLFDAPDGAAARKTLLDIGEKVNVLAIYKTYYLVSNAKETGWINY